MEWHKITDEKPEKEGWYLVWMEVDGSDAKWADTYWCENGPPDFSEMEFETEHVTYWAEIAPPVMP